MKTPSKLEACGIFAALFLIFGTFSLCFFLSVVPVAVAKSNGALITAWTNSTCVVSSYGPININNQYDHSDDDDYQSYTTYIIADVNDTHVIKHNTTVKENYNKKYSTFEDANRWQLQYNIGQSYPCWSNKKYTVFVKTDGLNSDMTAFITILTLILTTLSFPAIAFCVIWCIRKFYKTDNKMEYTTIN
jgi:hypothetical protein